MLAPIPPVTVVAALIQRDGRFLVCQRRRSDSFPLKWEFPGGKVHSGETSEAALVRELAEELGVTAQVGAEIYRTRHRYPESEFEFELIFFAAEIGAATVANRAFEQILWAPREALGALDFLEADRKLITLLAQGKLRL